MKNILNLIICLSFLSISFVSCQRETTVIEELEAEFKIVVHCYLDSDSGKQIICKVNNSLPVFGNTNQEKKTINDAIVEIGKNGEWFQLTFEEMSQDYRMLANEGFIVDNATYELRISHPDFPTANSSIKLLPKYVTDDINGKITQIKSASDTTKKLKYEITWQDDSRVNNFYRVIPQVGYINIDFPNDTFYMPPNYSKLILLNESYKKGDRMEWKAESDFFPFGENGFKPVSIKIYLLNIDKSYYEYHQFIQQVSSEGSFVEPSFFNGNINNAFGIFAACNGMSEKTFPLE